MQDVSASIPLTEGLARACLNMIAFNCDSQDDR